MIFSATFSANPTYAYWWIRQAITRAIAQQSRTIRLPIHVTEEINKIKKVQRKLSQQLGRTPTISEVAQESGFKLNRVSECLRMQEKPTSLDIRIGEDNNTSLSEIITDEGSTPFDYLEQISLREQIEEIISKLPPREQTVLFLKFGWYDGNSWSLSQIAKQLNISRERVRQLHNQAIIRLRQKCHALSDYVNR